MRDGRRHVLYKTANISVILASYANELYEHQAFMDDALLVHQPHFIDERFVFDIDKPRSNDVLLAGSVDATFYPFRSRLHELISSGRLTGTSEI